MNRLVMIAMVALGALALGCNPAANRAGGSDNTALADSQRVAPIVPVSAVSPIRRAISEKARTDSRIKAETRVEVTTEVMGRCIEVNFEEGDLVKKGAVLIRLDDSEQRAQLRSQQSQLDNAQREYVRMKELLQNGLKSEQEYESSWSQYEQQRETVNQTKEQIAKYIVRAPISGKITMEDVQVGQIVSSGTPIFTIVDPSSFMLKVQIEESEIPRLEPGQLALVTVDALGDQVFETRVRRVSSAIDEASGTVGVILDFAKEDIPKLRESAFARVDMIMDTRENALLVPKEAIIEDNARTYVFAVRELPKEEWPTDSDGPIYKAERLEISTGLEDSDYVEVLDGLGDQDRVVTYGQQTLKTDSFVRVTSAEDELASAGDVTAEEALKIAEARKARGAQNRSMFAPGPPN